MTMDVQVRSQTPPTYSPEFPLEPQGQPALAEPMGVAGLCDPYARQRPQGAEPWGFSTALITLTRDVGGNLSLSGGQTVSLFTAGA